MADATPTQHRKRKHEERDSPGPDENVSKLIGRTDLTDKGKENRPVPPTQTNISSAIPGSKSTCFRIRNIPLEWSQEDLLRVIKNFDSDFEEEARNLSLFPDCSGRTQTALLRLDLLTCSDYFRGVDPRKVKNQPIRDTAVVLVIDRQFLGLTPLNAPGADVVAE